MYTALSDVLKRKEDNYLLPFYWQHGDHTEMIPEGLLGDITLTYMK